MNSKKEIFDYIEKAMPDTQVIIFNDDCGEGYYDAFVGLTNDGRAVYDYNLMIDGLAHKYLESEKCQEVASCPYAEEDAYNDAVDWISYNTFRAMPYVGLNSPVIVCLSDNDGVEYEIVEGCKKDEVEVLFHDIEGTPHTARYAELCYGE